jgi:hypothetical protein
VRLLIVNVPRIATSPSLSPSPHPRPGWLLLPDPHARGGSWTRYPLRHPRPPVPTEEARRNRARLAALSLSPPLHRQISLAALCCSHSLRHVAAPGGGESPGKPSGESPLVALLQVGYIPSRWRQRADRYPALRDPVPRPAGDAASPTAHPRYRAEISHHPPPKESGHERCIRVCESRYQD